MPKKPTKTYSEKYKKGVEMEIPAFINLLKEEGIRLELRERSKLSDGSESYIVEMTIPKTK